MSRTTGTIPRLASVLVVVILTTAAQPASGTSEDANVLTTFHPGSPDEPAWTMLKLDVTRPNEEIWVNIQFTDMRCPMTWGFVFFRGPPGETVSIGSATFDFAMGQQGVIVYSTEEMPVTFHRSSMEDDGAERCPKSAGFNLGFSGLPLGEVYLLQFTAGTWFKSDAVVRAPSGGVRLVDTSSGPGTYYVNSTGFSSGPFRVGVHSPGTEMHPNTSPSGGLWHPCCYWPGDTHGGVDVSKNRHAVIEFERQPYFGFILPKTAAVSEAKILGPEGHAWHAEGMAGLGVGDTAINTQGIRSLGPLADYPPGVYDFRIEKNVALGVRTGVPWHVYAVDYHLPGT